MLDRINITSFNEHNEKSILIQLEENTGVNRFYYYNSEHKFGSTKTGSL